MTKNKQIKKRGRPPGQRAAQLEFQRLITENEDVEKVIDMIFEAALDDNHCIPSALVGHNPLIA